MRKSRGVVVDLFISGSCNVKNIQCKSIVDTTTDQSIFTAHETSTREDWTQPTDVWCWHCCHPFSSTPVYIPKSYDTRNTTFAVYGNFCSFACAKGYLIERNPHDTGRMMNLLKDIAIRVYKQDADAIVPAPSRMTLKVFGGTLSIDEFRKMDAQMFVDTPPFIPYQHVVQSVQADTSARWNVHGIRRQMDMPTVQQEGQRGMYFDFLKKQNEVEAGQAVEKPKGKSKAKSADGTLTRFIRTD